MQVLTPAFLLILTISTQTVSQGYPFVPLDSVFGTLRYQAQVGNFPSDEQLLMLGFKKANNGGFEIDLNSGKLSVLIVGPKRNAFTMGWNPKDPFPVIADTILAAIINKSIRIELMGTERMRLT